MKSTIFRNHQKTRLKRYLFPKFTVKSVVEHTQLDMTTIQAVLDEDDGIGSGCRNLHNMVTVAKTGTGRRLTKLSDEKMERVGDAIGFCLGCEGA